MGGRTVLTTAAAQTGEARQMPYLARLAWGAFGSIAVLLAISAAHAFEPVKVTAPDAPVELSVIGSYRGGVFSTNTPASPPVYNVGKRRLFVGSVDRSAIDVLDIRDPRSPKKV